MPGQSEPTYQPSASSPPHRHLSSPSRSSALYSADRNTQPADSSSCNVLRSLQPQPVETLSLQVPPGHPREDMSSSQRENHPVSASDMVTAAEQTANLGPHHADAAPDGTADSDEAFSALMAVPHYPHLANSTPNLPVSEVVNAVIERGQFFRQDHSSGQGTFGHHSSPPAELYMSDSEMTDALSELGGVSLGLYPPRQIGMVDLVNHLVDSSTAHHNLSAVFEDTEEDSSTDPIIDFEPRVARKHIAPSDDDFDEMQKFYYITENNEYEMDPANYTQSRRGSSHLSDIDFDEFYRGHDDGSQTTGFGPPSNHDEYNSFFTEGEDVNGDEPAAEAHFPDAVIHGTTQERNFNIDQFISQWLYQSSTASIPMISLAPTALPQNPISNIIHWAPPAKISRPYGYMGEFYDLQQIPWWETLRVKRADARQLRDQWYTSYHNLEYSRQRPGTRLSGEEFYFQGKSMYTECKATIEHFQLRNLMSVPAYNTVHFAHESKLYSWVPAYGDLKCLIDLSRPSAESGFQGSVKISTMKSAHDISIAGGFFGEYGMRAAGTEDKATEGFVTQDHNGITNHIDIIRSRTNRSPMGIFASNDHHLRTLDCETNTFISDHELSHAINCTSTSPDGRLRVVIGDSPDAWVVEAESGRPVHPLRGHRDFGFACAWSPDMRQIATSNQDKTAIIWDARTWKVLEKIESDVAGYRSLRFSPVGGGPRTLLLCEPADRIAVVNAQTYKTRQVHDFFGEIGGADYSPDGSTIWVANTDEHFGGFMEYDRRQWGQQYGLRHLPNEWIRESDLDEDERCLLSERERQLRFWWNLSDDEHEELLL